MLISTSRYANKDIRKLASNLFPFFGYEYVARVKKTLFQLFKIAERKGHLGVGIVRDDLRLDIFSWTIGWGLAGSFKIKEVFKLRRKETWIENIVCSINNDAIADAFSPNETDAGLIIKISGEGIDVINGAEKRIIRWERVI